MLFRIISISVFLLYVNFAVAMEEFPVCYQEYFSEIFKVCFKLKEERWYACYYDGRTLIRECLLEDLMKLNIRFFDKYKEEHTNITKDNIIIYSLNELNGGFLLLEKVWYFIHDYAEVIDLSTELCSDDKCSFSSTLPLRLMCAKANEREFSNVNIIKESKEKGLCEFEITWSTDKRNLYCSEGRGIVLKVNKFQPADASFTWFLFLKDGSSFDDDKTVFVLESPHFAEAYDRITKNRGSYLAQEQYQEISNFNEINNASKVTAICVVNKDITEIPTTIGDFSKLQFLCLDSNMIKEIPTEIGKCKELLYLSLSKNKITTIPTEIGELSGLHHLYIDNNELTTLPREFAKLKKLHKLSIEDNPIRDFPHEVANMDTVALRRGCDAACERMLQIERRVYGGTLKTFLKDTSRRQRVKRINNEKLREISEGIIKQWEDFKI
jgi:hypothetical protein